MPARDFYHNTVITALKKDGWTITPVFEEEAGSILLEDGVLRLFTFNPLDQEIVTWLPNS